MARVIMQTIGSLSLLLSVCLFYFHLTEANLYMTEDCNYKTLTGDCDEATNTREVMKATNVQGCESYVINEPCTVNRKNKCKYRRMKSDNPLDCDPVTMYTHVKKKLDEEVSDSSCPQYRTVSKKCCIFFKPQQTKCIGGKRNRTKMVDKEKSHPDCKDWTSKREKKCRPGHCNYETTVEKCDPFTNTKTITKVSTVPGCKTRTKAKSCKPHKGRKLRCKYDNVNGLVHVDCDFTTKTKLVVKQLKDDWSEQGCPKHKAETEKCCVYPKPPLKECIEGRMKITNIVDTHNSHDSCKDWVSKKTWICKTDCKYRIIKRRCDEMSNTRRIIKVSRVPGCERQVSVKTCWRRQRFDHFEIATDVENINNNYHEYQHNGNYISSGFEFPQNDFNNLHFEQ